MFSHGTADIILEACTDFWDGTDIYPLSGSDRWAACHLVCSGAAEQLQREPGHSLLEFPLHCLLSHLIEASSRL